MLDKKKLLGVGITDASEKEILEYILQSLKKSAEKYYIVTPNPEFLVFAATNTAFKQILNDARLALCDGIGVFWAGRILGKNLKTRTTGVDLMERLCFRVAEKPITVGFLGGGAKMAERAAECLKSKYPGLKVVFVGEEWNFGRLPHVAGDARSSIFKNKSLPRSLSERLSSNLHKKSTSTATAFSSPASGQAPSIDILFVAFGFPKQEEWMSEHVGKIPVKVMMGVGGAFDYLSGNIKRAPVFVRWLGLEWLFRLIIQPWRAKRQLALLQFVYLVLKEKISSN